MHRHLTSLSSLPGLLRAGSIEFGLFVAPIMTSWPLDSKPSRRVSSWATILFSSSLPLFPLLGQRASSSSMNKTHGPYCDAFLKELQHFHNFLTRKVFINFALLSLCLLFRVQGDSMVFIKKTKLLHAVAHKSTQCIITILLLCSSIFLALLTVLSCSVNILPCHFECFS